MRRFLLIGVLLAAGISFVSAQTLEPQLITIQPGNWTDWDMTYGECGYDWLENLFIDYLPAQDDRVLQARADCILDFDSLFGETVLPEDADLPLRAVSHDAIIDADGEFFGNFDFGFTPGVTNLTHVFTYYQDWHDNVYYALEEISDTTSLIWFFHSDGSTTSLDTIEVNPDGVQMLYPRTYGTLDQPSGLFWTLPDGAGIVRYRPMMDPVLDTLFCPESENTMYCAADDEGSYWMMRTVNDTLVEHWAWCAFNYNGPDSVWILEESSYLEEPLQGCYASWTNRFIYNDYYLIDIWPTVWIYGDLTETIDHRVCDDVEGYDYGPIEVDGTINRIETGFTWAFVCDWGMSFVRWVVYSTYDEITDTTTLWAVPVEHYAPYSAPESSSVPSGFVLSEPWPNPFNSTVNIGFTLESPQYVSLDIYSILGRHLETLVDRPHDAGSHTVHWNANGYASGTYLLTVRSGEQQFSRRITLLK